MKKELLYETEITEGDVSDFIATKEGGVIGHTRFLCGILAITSPAEVDEMFASFEMLRPRTGMAERLKQLGDVFARYEGRTGP